jgi:hypothetical protein
MDLQACVELELEHFQADVISEPGAKTSTQLPKLLKEDRASVFVVEPTVRATGILAGEVPHAFALEFPAATTTETFAATAFSTALVSNAEDSAIPRLMLMTQGLLLF